MKKKLVSILAAFVFSAAHAGGGMTGGSTEITQLLNFAELTSQTTETIQQTSTQIAQLVNLQRMLTTAPGAVLGQMGLPTNQLSSAMNLYGSVSQARQALTSANSSMGSFQTAIYSINRAASISNQEVLPYLKSRIEYAQKNNTALDADIQQGQQAMDNFAQANSDYQAAAANIPSLVGTTDNLQTMNQSMMKQGMMMGQANSLLGSMLTQNAVKRKEEQADDAAQAAYQGQINNRYRSGSSYTPSNTNYSGSTFNIR